ncbi:MAG: hypothetical protein ACRDF4_05075, partial [Rhabdochlamydiaceae bacterium]
NQFTPYYLMFGREPNLPIDAMSRMDSEEYLSAGEFARDVIHKMRTAHALAERNQRVIHQKYVEKAMDASVREFKEGDLVMARFFTPPAPVGGKTPKLSHLWRGPFKVLKRLDTTRYLVEIPNSRTNQMIHINRLKGFHQTLTGWRDYSRLEKGIEKENEIREEAERQVREESEQ